MRGCCHAVTIPSSRWCPVLCVLQCELDFITHVEECHYILDEMCMNGQVVDASTPNALAPLKLMNKVTK